MVKGAKMENLNAEQVIRAFECCHSILLGCSDCPFINDSQACASSDIFALEVLKSQNQRIKELAEERDGFENLAYTAIETQNDMSDTIEQLTEENERLSADCAKGANALIEEMRKNRTIEADTVRKMQERLKEKVYSVPTVYNAHFGRMIDQIVKEMIENG
jgi:phage-related tail protein